jgi:hypothetical protein
MQQPYYPPQQPMQPPPKKGMGALGIVLIILGVLFVLGLGTCIGGYFWVKGKVSELVEGGAIDLTSPPAVTAALAGPKKDYIGNWKAKSGSSSLDIDSSGQMHYQKSRSGNNENINAPIGAFVGDDIEVHMLVKLTIRVTKAPNKKGAKWEMTADGIDFERPDTP